MEAIRSESRFKTPDSLQLYEQFWELENPLAHLIILHGFAEHSTRYTWAAARLAQQGFSVHTFDLRGHGRSEGDRCFVRSFNEYLDDFHLFLERVRTRIGGQPLFLFGHSMGGSIAAWYVIQQQPNFRGLILSSAAIAPGNQTPGWLARIAPVIGRLFPKLPTTKIDAKAVTRDSQMVASYENDPLVFKGRIPARTGAEILQAGKAIRSSMEAIALPLLVQHGTGDTIAKPEASKNLYEAARSEDKSLQLYEGLYHELFNELERAQVLENLITWIGDRSSGEGS